MVSVFQQETFLFRCERMCCSLVIYAWIVITDAHSSVGSDDDIECEWMTKRQWKGKEVYAPSGKTWIFASKSLSNVSRDAYIIEPGEMKNKKMLRISIDVVEAY